MATRVKRSRRKKSRGIDVNILGVAAAALLLSYSFSFAPPTVIVKSSTSMLGSASVGASATVDENPFNTLAQQLVNKERELQERENVIGQREVLLDARDAPIAFYSLALSLMLCFMVVANFYFDWRRERKLLAVNA